MFSTLAGISTGLLGLVWGGVEYFLIAICGAVLLFFLFGKVDKKRFWFFTMWMIISFASMMPFSDRYSLDNIIHSNSNCVSVGCFLYFGCRLFIIQKENF